MWTSFLYQIIEQLFTCIIHCRCSCYPVLYVWGSKAVWCGNEISILEGNPDASRKPSSYWATPSYPRNLQKNTSRAFHCHVQLPEGNCTIPNDWIGREMCTVYASSKKTGSWGLPFKKWWLSVKLSALSFHPPFFYWWYPQVLPITMAETHYHDISIASSNL